MTLHWGWFYYNNNSTARLYTILTQCQCLLQVNRRLYIYIHVNAIFTVAAFRGGVVLIYRRWIEFTSAQKLIQSFWLQSPSWALHPQIIWIMIAGGSSVWIVKCYHNAHFNIIIPFECELYYNQIMMMENGTVMIKGIILIETLHLYRYSFLVSLKYHWRTEFVLDSFIVFLFVLNVNWSPFHSLFYSGILFIWLCFTGRMRRSWIYYYSIFLSTHSLTQLIRKSGTVIHSRYLHGSSSATAGTIRAHQSFDIISQIPNPLEIWTI